MGRTKISYLMAYGLGQAFKEQLIYDVRQSALLACSMMKQHKAGWRNRWNYIDLHYWPAEHDEVWVRYLTLTFSFADGKTVSNSITSSLKNDNRRVRRGVHLGKKVPLRNVQKRREISAQICRQKSVHVPLRYHKIKTKKLGKKEENIKRKGLKLKK